VKVLEQEEQEGTKVRETRFPRMEAELPLPLLLLLLLRAYIWQGNGIYVTPSTLLELGVRALPRLAVKLRVNMWLSLASL
jgi:hypothetical protein